jgi:hypothetical protein
MKHPVILLLLVTSFAPWVHGQDETKKNEPVVDPVATRELIAQWVKTERILSEEKSAWQVEKKRMQDLLDLYQKELGLLDEEIDKAGASAGLVDENKEKFVSELKQFREAQQLLRSTMARLLPRVKSLMGLFPQPLLDEITTDADLLRSPSALEKPREVLKSMIAVLTASGRFNRSITVEDEVRELSEGKQVTVDVLYLGLCRAYYTTGAGDTAGVGVPSETGWEWKPEPVLADDIRRTIAVYQKDKQPQLIKLPVKVSGSENK